jgi:hypothetical protein
MRHHIGVMANADPVKPINGKRLILILGVGSVLFAAIMGFGTYFVAQLITPLLQKHPAEKPRIQYLKPEKPPEYP